MAENKNVIQLEYKDSIELVLEYSPHLKKHILEIQLTSYECKPNDFIVANKEQVDMLIQKLLDIRREWPREKTEKWNSVTLPLN